MIKDMPLDHLRALFETVSAPNAEHSFNSERPLSKENEGYSQELNTEWKEQNTDVVFVCAVDDEYNAFKEYLKYIGVTIEYSVKIDGFYFVLNNNPKDIQCILVKQKEAGMVSCACLCGRLLNYRPQLVVMSGICGGINGKVSQGDIVAASTVYDYGSGKYHQDGTFEPAPYQCQVNAKLSRCINAANEYLKDILDSCAPYVLNVKDDHGNVFTKNESNIHVRQGTFATGASVVNNSSIIEAMRSRNRNVLAYDMEAYALAYTCTYFSDMPTPWLVIKGVQDFPDTTDKGMYTKLAAYVSAAVAIDVTKRFFVK